MEAINTALQQTSLGGVGQSKYTGPRIILATVYPRAGKINRIIELYQPIIRRAELHEPGCIQFQLFVDATESGEEVLYTIEKFKDLKLLREHQKSQELVTFNEITAKENLMAQEVLVNVVKPVSGFSV